MSGATRNSTKTLIISCLLSLMNGCSKRDDISAQIADQFDHASTVDLALVGPKGWDRVCILGPYSSNKDAKRVLGFAWDVEAKTSVAANDSINVIVFVAGDSVVAYTEHPRDNGDFANVASTCSLRREARLVRNPDRWTLDWRRK